MTDPMNAFVSLQQALDDQEIPLQSGDKHKDILVISQSFPGFQRMTYAKVEGGTVQSMVMFVLMGQSDGFLCFQLGWATLESERGRGHATEIVGKGMEELRDGLKAKGIKKIRMEAVISDSNLPSNKLALKLISDLPESCTDSFSGEAAQRYLREFK